MGRLAVDIVQNVALLEQEFILSVLHRFFTASTDTAVYCRTRQAERTRQTGNRQLRDAPARWFWHGRHVKIVDGTTLSMPDTPANQQHYPQISAQQPGIGFPILRSVPINQGMFRRWAADSADSFADIAQRGQCA